MVRNNPEKGGQAMQKLVTQEGLHLPAVPWERYPRPQMQRERWLCLNGEWSFSFGGEKKTAITVPFCPESLLSGISDPPSPGKQMIYERIFEIPDDWTGSRILLHFGAVSRACTVSVNDREACSSDQAYLSFSADITEALLPGKNCLRVSVVNDLSTKYPWGKQSRKRGGMWYTPVSGIWQTVWLEPVPKSYIENLTIAIGKDDAEICTEGASEGWILFEGRQIPLQNGKARISPDSPLFWTPERPHLYSFEVICGEDRVRSYFALRSLSVEQVDGMPRLCLNGKPYFFNGLLDQGYWSDGLYTPAGPEAFETDILSMKSLGFNTLRKHIKIEPEQFYYDCDRLGMIVFQDMVNNGAYSFLHDTVLPTIGMTRLSDESLNRDPETRSNFLESMKRTVRQLGNHPCICLWTIFNEGWGQFCADAAFARLKKLDNSRWIDSTSGWFRQKQSDVESLHIYFGKLHLGNENRPQLLSEFGGYSYKIFEHSFNLRQTYGYRKFKVRETYVKEMQALYREIKLLAAKGLSGAIYTQVSDVEDETNGLFTYDRVILKILPEELKPYTEALQIPQSEEAEES